MLLIVVESGVLNHLDHPAIQIYKIFNYLLGFLVDYFISLLYERINLQTFKL